MRTLVVLAVVWPLVMLAAALALGAWFGHRER